MAPEQVRDSRSAGPQADLYSVGAILYALLSGRPPFEGDSDMAIVAQVLTEAPSPLQQLNLDLPDELCALVDSCLSKDPRQRPASAAAVREALLALAAPDDAWLFARVRELTPTEPRPSNPGNATPSRPSRPSGTSKRRATPTRAQKAAQPAPGEERPGATITNSGAMSGGVRALVGGLVAVIVVAGAGIVYVVTRPAPIKAPGGDDVGKVITAPPEVVAAPAEPAVQPPTAPPRIELTLKAEPPEARWEVGGVPACNPCTVTRDQGARLVARVTAEGFAASELNLDFDAARLVTVALEPVAKPTAAATKRPGGTKPRPPPTGTPKKTLELDESNPYPSK
jgi:serine/threonine-protein kinase